MALTQALTGARTRARTKVKLGKQAKREERVFYLFILPWIVGFILFDAGPIIASFIVSLTDWTILGSPHWIGLDNYHRLANDQTFSKALHNTIYFTIGTVSLGIVFAFILAMLLNQPIRGVALFRLAFYMPVLVSGIAVAILWTNILHPDYGLINASLAKVGIAGPGWLKDQQWAMPGLILMSLWGGVGLWGVGGLTVIFLAGLQGVPQHLYEAAVLDGAGPWSKFRNVTVPMMSPVIFYNIIVGIITALQSFVLILIMTDGRPANSTLVLGLYLYRNAFRFLDLGYASAISWVMLLGIVLITMAHFAIGKFWVYYEGDTPG
ncbi:MAG: carbohydrate ABC transporter permease [Thermomicrobiales bacterium]|jgi:multiple sugar transport system permease protein